MTFLNQPPLMHKGRLVNDSTQGMIRDWLMCQKARAKKSQGAAESLELHPASLCLLFPVFKGLFRRLISQANRLC